MSSSRLNQPESFRRKVFGPAYLEPPSSGNSLSEFVQVNWSPERSEYEREFEVNSEVPVVKDAVDANGEANDCVTSLFLSPNKESKLKNHVDRPVPNQIREEKAITSALYSIAAIAARSQDSRRGGLSLVVAEVLYKILEDLRIRCPIVYWNITDVAHAAR